MGKATGPIRKTEARKSPTAVARRPMVASVVESPYGNGVDHVLVVDTVQAMVRQRMLDPRQYEAAMRYRRAFDAVFASGSNILGRELIDETPKAGHSDGRLAGAADLRSASQLLGGFEFAVRWVVGEGRTLDELARHFGGGKAGRGERSAASNVVRIALRILADDWLPERREIAGHREGGDVPPVSTGEPVMPDAVAHCTARKVFWS